MTLAAGFRLGPYEVLSPLGAGGMGEVYRARDPRLSREVAIKVLPSEVASDASRLKRFEKEARSASALNHPNIVTVYDIGTTEGVSWIAMERVEGETLRKVLMGGAMPVKKLLPIAAQFTDALAKAHEAGIVHRDLKPENVMVTKDGHVKILDFGLAKLTGPVSGSDEGSHLPTETGTSPGMIVGTAGYMSPEQASGQAVDYRSDQFSFGSILYEMVTGRRAFQKKTGVDTLAAILNEEPEPISKASPQTPPPLRWIAERCLAKDPEQRYASTKDLAWDLATLRDRIADFEPSETHPGSGVRRGHLAPLMGLLAFAAVALAGAAVWMGRKDARAEPPSFRRLTFRQGVVMNARFTPDGQSAVYSASFDGEPPRIYSAPLQAGAGSLPLPLPSADLFSVSEAGELAIGLEGNTLARAPLSGGGARQVLERVLSAGWTNDGALAVARYSLEARTLEFPIGKVLYSTKGWIRVVRVSPDGERVAFADHPVLGDERGAIAVIDREGRKAAVTPEFKSLNALAWSPRGDEIWYSGPGGTFRAVSLSGRDRLLMRIPESGGLEDVSRDGRILLSLYRGRGALTGVPAGESEERDLSWLDSSVAADLSADGKTLLFSEEGDGSGSKHHDVYLRRLDGSAPVRLGEGDPRSLSPGGEWACVVVATDPPRLEILPTGPGEKRALERNGLLEYRNVNWFPDGRRLFFTAIGAGGKTRGYAQPIEGGPPAPLTPEGFSLTPAISPDGLRIVVRKPDRSYGLLTIGNGAIGPALGVEPSDRPIRFDAEGRSIYVEQGGDGAPIEVVRVDLASGRRVPHRRIAPPDLVGVERLGRVRLTADGKSYVYSYARFLSDLYLVEGLR